MFRLSSPFLKQLWLTVSASLGFMVIGLLRGYSSSAIPSIEKYNPEIIHSDEQKSWIGAISPLCAFFGGLLSGPLMSRMGRRRALLLTAPLWATGWIVVGFAQQIAIVLLGRGITGICAGLALAPVQVYVSECCDPEIRGRLGSLPTVSMSLGILISYIAGNWLFWRYLAFFSAAFCVMLFVALLPLPESPVWLETKGLDSSGSVEWLHLSDHGVATLDNEKIEKEDPPSLFTREVFFSPSVMKPLVVGFVLLILQQFTGTDAIIFFTVDIFQSAGSKIDAMTATIIVGLVQLIFNGIEVTVVDHAGRRPLLLLSAVIMCASMTAMGCSYYFEYENVTWLGYLPIASLVLFMLGFSVGFGGLPFLLLGELFPAHYRSQLSGMASAVNLLSMFIVIKSYFELDTALTTAGTFWLYACFCALAFFFVLFLVPETKGKSLAEIEEHFRGKKTISNVTIEITAVP